MTMANVEGFERGCQIGHQGLFLRDATSSSESGHFGTNDQGAS